MATAALTSSGVGLVEAAEDPRLFGLKLSDRQRELLTLIETNGTVVAAAGRQSGKTLLCAVAATYNAVLRPDLDTLTGTRYIISVANSKEQATILLNYVRELCDGSPLLRKRIEQRRDDRITFLSGVALVAQPCQDRLTRGRRASLIICDEAGWFVNATDGPRTLERIYAALRPSLVTFGPLGKAVLVSTPGESDYFHRLHSQASAGEIPNGAGFSAPTAAMNPTVDPAFLESERVTLGEATYRQEYMAEFVAGGASAFFDDDLIRAVTGRYSELPASAGVGWVVSLDQSFAGDPSGLAVIGREKDQRDRLLVARVERLGPKRSRTARRMAKTAAERKEVEDVVLDRAAALSEAYSGAAVIVDQHLSEVTREGLKARGVSQVIVQRWSGTTITEAMRMLRTRMLSDKISLPAERDLAAELLRIRQKVRGGATAIEVPRTTLSHCDLAMAVAAGVLRLETKGTPARARTLSSFRNAGPVIPAKLWDEFEPRWGLR